MRRFVTLLVLLMVSVPFGISISGCGKKDPVTYCNASSGSGVQVGQLNNIVLQPVVYGISLNYGQIGQLAAPVGTDCKGTAVTPKAYTYGSKDVTIVDINPATGALCAGTWNRNLNVIPDFTVCTAPTNPDPNHSMTSVVAEANDVTSNSIPVFTHPVVTSVLLSAQATPCSAEPTADQTTNCCPLAASNPVTADPYTGDSCISQGITRQFAARAFSGAGTYNTTNGTTTGSLQNISCQVGHLNFAAQTPGIVAIDENGVATAQQPGSTVITASIANTSGSSAGFFSTCAPTNITLSAPNTSATNIPVTQNFSQPLIATVTDQNNTVLSGLTLEYVSTTPTTIPVASTGVVTPTFSGSASITAICQPPSCNPAPFNQIGVFGNGKPITSNPIGITTPGSNSTILFLASTQSRYFVPVDFTTSLVGTPIQLPYVPNSMVISTDGTTLYMGTPTELMTVSAVSGGVTREDPTVPGTVLSVSPDSSTIVIADTARNLIYLEAATGGINTQYSGVGTHAQWTPDSQTVYITAADPSTGGTQLLVHSTFTGWNNITPPVTPLDVAVTVPSVGAYLAGASETDAIGYCPNSTITTTGGQSTANNVFNPQADSVATATDRIAATDDGKHIIGAAASSMAVSDLHVTLPTGPCPASGAGLTFTSALTTTPLTVITPTAITGVATTSDSTTAVVTYTGAGAVLPAYTTTSTGAAGTVTNVPLSGSATAPVAGVWSTDDLTFYAGTSGDNLVHIITRSTPGGPLTDSKTIDPKLTIDPAIAPNGSATLPATPNLVAQKPRQTL